ncbi:MAG: DNA repair protein RadC [Gammaproteobacteria bacterium]|nr:DNA repair protein RadC [Gammaproteobacteria bacterium]
MSTIQQLPCNERPREKLLQQGADALTDAELLAIFLRVGIQGMNAIELAQHLLDECGGMARLLSASQAEFCRLRGLGSAKYAQLQAVLALSRRHHLAQLTTQSVINSTNSAVALLSEHLSHQSNEVIAALFLNSKHQLITFEIISQGSLREAPIYPREIAKRAFHHNAGALILAHNHPSGDATPSKVDIDVTYSLAKTLKPLDIRLLDHIIIGKGLSYTSLVEARLFNASDY